MSSTDHQAPPPSGDLDLLRGYLAHRDVPCPQCRYNLRGLTGEYCPECGQWLSLSVHSNRSKQGPALLALIGLAGGAAIFGYGALWGLYALFSTVFWYYWDAYSVFLIARTVASVAVNAAFIVGIVLLWRRWDRFLACKRGTQSLLAAIFLALPIITSVAFMIVESVVTRYFW